VSEKETSFVTEDMLFDPFYWCLVWMLWGTDLSHKIQVFNLEVYLKQRVIIYFLTAEAPVSDLKRLQSSHKNETLECSTV